MKKQYIIPALIIGLTICLPFLSHAQPPVFGGGDDVNDVPLDGGLSVVIAAGVGYGVKKIKEKRKN